MSTSFQFSGLYSDRQGKIGTGQLAFFLRRDYKDRHRNAVIIEEGNFFIFADHEERIKILLGYQTYHWSIMEAFHLVNNINSVDYTSHSKNLKKRGELGLELEKSFDSGSIALYFFPRFERPILSAKRSRRGPEVDFAPPLIINRQEIKQGRSIPQFGARVTWEGEGFSFSLYSLYHIDRNAPIYGTHQYRVVRTDDDVDQDIPPPDDDFFDDLPADNQELSRQAATGPSDIVVTVPERKTEDSEQEGCRICYFPKNIKAFEFHPTPYYIGVWEIGTTLQWPYREATFKLEGVWEEI